MSQTFITIPLKASKSLDACLKKIEKGRELPQKLIYSLQDCFHLLIQLPYALWSASNRTKSRRGHFG